MRARSTASRMSLTPESTAEMAMKSAPKACAVSRARVVFPRPAVPQNHRMQLAGIKGEFKRLARPQKMALADNFAQGARTQAFGQRHVSWMRGRGTGLKQVVSH